MSDAIALEVHVNGINNINDLKSALKDAKNELLQFEVGTQGFTRAQAKVSALQEKINGLGDSARIQGTGVERLSQSFSLLTESLSTGDIDKAKLAFTGLGQAMSAIPIFLLIQGIMLLIQNFDEVVKIFNSFTAEGKANEAAIRSLNTAYNGVIENLTKINDLQTELIKNSDYSTKVAIENAKQRGAKEEEINQIQIDGNKRKLDILARAEENYRKQLAFADGNLIAAYKTNNDELIKLATDAQKSALTAYKKAKSDTEQAERDSTLAIEAIETASYQKRLKMAKEHEAKHRERSAARVAQFILDLVNEQNYQEKSAAAEIEQEMLKNQAIIDDYLKKKQEQKDFNDAIREGEKKDDELAAQSKLDLEKRLTEYKKQQEQARLDSQKIGIQAAQGLSEAFFQFQLNAAQGDAKRQIEIKKQMFEVDKAFNVARAVQDGIRSVQAALTIPPPGGQILAIVNAGLAAANVAKILATKFDPGSASVSSSVSAPSLSPSQPQAPVIQSPTTSSTLLGKDGNPQTQYQHDQQVISAYVLSEQQISNKVKNRTRIEEQARF